MYQQNKEAIEELFFDGWAPITEKVVMSCLIKHGVSINKISAYPEISNCPFNKGGIHKADFLIQQETGGDQLYIEVKGQMTYLEVNKLHFLYKHSGKHIYILQLTEIDWIKEFDKDRDGSKMNKFKTDFEKQFEELLKFYRGNETAEYLSKLSKNRLDSYIRLRKKDIKKWESKLPEQL